MNKYPPIAYRNGKRYFFRFSLVQRVQHIILFTTVIVLALTGFPLRYYDQPWAKGLYDFFGGIDKAPWIHRITGLILLALFVFHTCYWIYLFFKNRVGRLIRENELTVRNLIREFFSMEMIPNKKDVIDFLSMWKYLLFLSSNRPQYDRISWKEKFDYFAPYWGIPILGPAGLALWFRDEITQYVPGIILNAFYIMHTDEALLAAIFLFFVHWYNVHYSPEKFPMATVFLTGYLSEEEMIHEHYDEYKRTMKENDLENQIVPQNH
jgi:cytochrome b subunit of formate dehydrogenase